MANSKLVPINGVIQSITSISGDCCSLQVTLRSTEGVNNFIIGPATYVAQETRLRQGMSVTGFYDASLPIPLIFPPRYQAVIMTRRNPNETIYAGYFNNELVSEDNSLKLNLARSTEIITSNGQPFSCNLGGQLLIVYYTTSTRSIPAQTTPRKIVVLC